MKEKNNRSKGLPRVKLSKSPGLTPDQIKHANDLVTEHKKKALEEYPPEIDFNPEAINDYLFSYSTSDIFNAFDKLVSKNKKKMSSKDYWYALGQAHTDSDNSFFHREKTIKYFTAAIENRDYLMSTSERLKLTELPDMVKIYRAMTTEEAESGKKDPREYGISWTLSEKVAAFFAEEYLGNLIHLPGMDKAIKLEKIIVNKTVPKEKIIAYFNGKKEDVIIYFPWL